MNMIAHYVELILLIIGIFSVVATLTPNTVDNKILEFILKVVNFLGANFLGARNAD